MEMSTDSVSWCLLLGSPGTQSGGPRASKWGTHWDLASLILSVSYQYCNHEALPSFSNHLPGSLSSANTCKLSFQVKNKRCHAEKEHDQSGSSIYQDVY